MCDKKNAFSKIFNGAFFGLRIKCGGFCIAQDFSANLRNWDDNFIITFFLNEYPLANMSHTNSAKPKQHENKKRNDTKTPGSSKG